MRRPVDRRGEFGRPLDRKVDQLAVDLAVPKGVGHRGVQLRDHQAASRPHPFEGGDENVHLDAHRDAPVTLGGRVQKEDVRRAQSVEQPRDQGETHWQVVELRPGTPHPRADERRLEDHALALRKRPLCGEHEQPVALPGLVHDPQGQLRNSVIAAGDDPRLVPGHGRDGFVQLAFGDDPHGG